MIHYIGKKLSNTERERNRSLNQISLTYGEIDYGSFYKILTSIIVVDNSKPSTLTFYDLGSGTGKAVITAAMSQDCFSTSIGIEILESLHNQGINVVNSFKDTFSQHLYARSPPTQDCPETTVSLIKASILEYDWSDGDVVFANSTCFNDDLMSKIAVKAEHLKPGSLFITFTKSLESKRFEIVDRTRYKMSWGLATVYIHRRLYDNEESRFEPFVMNHWRLKCKTIDANNNKSLDSVEFSGNIHGNPFIQDLTDVKPFMLRPTSSLLCSYLFSKPYEFPSSSKSMESMSCALWVSHDWSVETYANKPLTVVLSSQSSSDVTALKEIGLLSLLESSSDLWDSIDGIVCCVLCPKNRDWRSETMGNALQELVEAIIQQFSSNRSQVYLTGFSKLGGLGAWMIAARKTHLFHAIMPLSGGGSPVYAPLLRDMPWLVD